MKSSTKNGSEHRVLIAWRVNRQTAAEFECSFEALLQRGIGYQVVFSDEVLILHEEFGLQNVQTIELGKKVSGGVRGWPHWIVRVQPLPFMERLMGFGEL